MKLTCLVDDCKKSVHGRGYCGKHYKRLMANGDPLKTQVRPKGLEVAEAIDYSVIRGNACWGWSGSIDQDGYPTFWWQGKTRKVLRHAYEEFNGPIPEGHLVRHSCDNTECLRPDHLLTGTNGDNVRDSVERGRATSGSRRLKPGERLAIIDRFSEGASKSQIAREFGVSRYTVRYTIANAEEVRVWHH